MIGALVVRPENSIGEFRISLLPPDYASESAVQMHLIHSKVWARLITGALFSITQGKCSVVATPTEFPDIWAYLIVERPSGDIEADRRVCVRALDETLSTYQPDHRSVVQVVSQLYLEAYLAKTNPPAIGSQVSNIIQAALAKIYAPDTVMRSLVAVGPEHLRLSSPHLFFQWLERLRSVGIRFNKIPTCSLAELDWGHAQLAKRSKAPYPGGVDPGVPGVPMTVSGILGHPALHHAVIVGINPDYQLPRSFCQNREYLVRGSGGAEMKITARCQADRISFDSWLALYCDPHDCTNETVSLAVAKAIVSDPEVVSLGQKATENGEIRGPYLVNLKASDN